MKQVSILEKEKQPESTKLGWPSSFLMTYFMWLNYKVKFQPHISLDICLVSVWISLIEPFEYFIWLFPNLTRLFSSEIINGGWRNN